MLRELKDGNGLTYDKMDEIGHKEIELSQASTQNNATSLSKKEKRSHLLAYRKGM